MSGFHCEDVRFGVASGMPLGELRIQPQPLRKVAVHDMAEAPSPTVGHRVDVAVEGLKQLRGVDPFRLGVHFFVAVEAVAVVGFAAKMREHPKIYLPLDASFEQPARDDAKERSYRHSFSFWV